jgi:F0F1-type ATP synthase assembly protein I
MLRGRPDGSGRFWEVQAGRRGGEGITIPGHRSNQRALGLTSVAFVMAAAVALPTWLGHYLDERWHTGGPWLTLAGLFLGMAAAFVEMFRMLKTLGD